MLFQPSNIIPSTLAGINESTIDAGSSLYISWQLNGNSPLYAYKIQIFLRNSDGTLTEKGNVTYILDVPIYPNDNKGNPQNCICSTERLWSSLGVENGNDYQLQLTQYWALSSSGGIPSDNYAVVQFSPTVFKARTTPTLSINSIPSVITSPAYKFTATYAQAQGDAINWARWQLFSGNTLIADTLPISTADLSFTYDGFIVSNNTFRIVCTVETANGVQVSDEKTFTVQAELSATGTAVAKSQNAYSVVSNDITFPYFSIPGEASGTSPSFLAGLLNLENSSLVRWNNTNSGQLNISAPWSLSIKFTIKSTTDNIVIALSNDTNSLQIELTPGDLSNDNQLRIRINNNYINLGSSTSYLINSALTAFQIVVSPTKIYLYSYRSGIEAMLAEFTISLDSWQSSIENVVIYGARYYGWIWIGNKVLTSSLSVSEAQWSNNDTAFCTNFSQETLDAGDINNLQSSFSIYRVENDGNAKKLVKLPRSYAQFRDFGVKSNAKYKYVITPNANTIYGASVVSNEIYQCENAYYLIKAQNNINDDPDVYYVTGYWKFGNNIAYGAISNNNTPNWLTNFTGYRLRQPSSRKGRSGTLQALLSNTTNANYFDNVEKMQELYSASVSEDTFFLKDPKGNLFQVGISAPITQTINTKTGTQEVSVSISWEEIGSAEDVALIQLPQADGTFANLKKN